MSDAPPDLNDRIDALLPLVEKPARYLGTEIGVRRKAPDETRVSWLLILPDVYEIGMSHQGLRILYDILNRRDDAVAERAFAPWVDMEARMREEHIPLFSLESRRAARTFDLIGFSLQYELLATNLLNLLDLAGIPLYSRDRTEDDPIIAAGGPCTGNPEPLAEFVDFFLIGDGEDMVGRITSSIAATRGRPREDRLNQLSRIPGIYVPRFYDPVYRDGRQVGVTPRGDSPCPVHRTFIDDLDRAPYPRRPIIPMIEAVQDRLTLEILRGCTQGCRFCQAGIFYRPVRERGAERLVDLIATGLPATGWDEISLSSLSSADHSQIVPLTRALTRVLEPSRVGLSFSSLRIDTFSVQLAEQVARVRKTGFTFAPEAGTQRLREVINKRVTDEDLLQAVEAAYARGWRRVKLYFMIGLPTETESDLEGIVDLTRRVREIGRRYGGGNKVTISIGSFVPKAHTPFQWEAFEDRDALRAKAQHLKSSIQSRWSAFRWHDPDVSYIESLLSRGDRRLAPVLIDVWKAGGRFDGWTDHFRIERWEDALRAHSIDPDRYTGPLDPAGSLPWDHIHLGVERSWLRRERDRALAGETTPDCRTAPCTGCGLGCAAPRALAPGLEPEAWRRIEADLQAAIGPEPTDASREMLRYRLTYAKTGRLRFISHLETGRLLARIFRMARWPLAFSAGHHPHPKVGYGPPLPLGVEGERELLDLQVLDTLSAQHVASANAAAPEGLEIRDWQHLAVKPLSLAAAARSATYSVRMPADLRRRAESEKRTQAFHDAGSLITLKASKGRQKTIDLKRSVIALTWSDEADALQMVLRLQEPSGHVLGPLPTLREVFKWTDRDLGRCRVIRLRLALGD